MAPETATAKLYVILGSHACRAAMLMLEHKGVNYRTVRLPSGSQTALRLVGYPGGTVPALRIDGERVQTNRKIARFLDRLRPDPPLFPADPERRGEAESVETWADEVLQMAARRVVLAGALHGRDGLVDCANSGPLGPLVWRNDRVRLLGFRLAGRVFNVNRATEPRLLAAIPGLLDKIDVWIDAGVLGGAELNAADFQVAPCVALLRYRPELKAEVEARPAGRLVDRLLPG